MEILLDWKLCGCEAINDLWAGKPFKHIRIGWEAAKELVGWEVLKTNWLGSHLQDVGWEAIKKNGLGSLVNQLAGKHLQKFGLGSPLT